jgi:diacylglycerol kinase (ATP)
VQTRRVGLVVNPTAGGGRAKDVGARFARDLTSAGLQVVGLSALGAEAALENVRRALPSIEALVVVGGDGMVHLGIQALAETSVPLGVLPVGTGNDFAGVVGIPRSPRKASAELARRLREREAPRSVDLLRVQGPGVQGDRGDTRWVAGAVSAGLDAAVNARANALRFPRGSSRYVVSAVREILGYRAWTYRLRADGVPLSAAQRAALAEFPGVSIGRADAGGEYAVSWDQRGALVTAANGARIGGGIRVAPSARVDDGYLDLVLARDVGRLTAARLFPLLLAGAHLRSTHLRAMTARAVTIESIDAPAVYGDGERIGSAPVQVEVLAGALRLLA